MEKFFEFINQLTQKIAVLKLNKKLMIKVTAGTIILVVAFVVFLGKSKEPPGAELGVTDVTSQAEEQPNQADLKKEELDKIYIDVTGSVAHPAVVELEKGSRVFQVINKVGGITPEGDTKYINLAAELSDGQKLYIPTKTEVEEMEVQNGYNGFSNDDRDSFHINSTPDPFNSNGVSSKGSTHLININTANSTELQQLNGVGPSTAEKIITHRQEYGPFDKIEDLKNVSGIGEKTFSKFKDKICVSCP